ncbi:MAG: patatin family protein [Saprospiraceae bacterium]|nr:MAG: patatin family protein [Saprospiraceae bacterium]
MKNADNDTCLIVEGGGFKTGFTSGILDALMVSQFRPFNQYIGISGGAVALSYFLSKQYRFCLNAILLLAQDKNFTNYKRTLGEQGFMDIDFIAAVAEKEVRFDLNKALTESNQYPVNFIATNRKTGSPGYIVPTANTWIDALIASCALPFVTKGKHQLAGEEYFDGGWSDPLPVKWAYKQGAKKILVLRTWPAGIRSAQSWTDYFGSIYYSSEPQLKTVFEKCHQNYNEGVAFIENPPDDVTIEQIAPVKLLKSGTYSYSKKSIMGDYRYGLDCGVRYVEKVRQDRT